MSEDWFDLLTKQEDILTYAHLSNLTQQEWDKIKKLPMNALKTIKFYVDQEKNMTAARKMTTKNKKSGKMRVSYRVFPPTFYTTSISPRCSP
jgi:hypothetical protein